MIESVVRVGGVEVNQVTLERAYQWLVRHGCSSIPADHAPTLEKFRPYKGTVVSEPEEFVHMLFAREVDYEGFRQAFLTDGPKAHPIRPRMQVLKAAGVPLLYWKPSSGGITDPKADAWIDGYVGQRSPWLWVMAGHEDDRTAALADLAVKVASVMDRDVCAAGEIRYTRARDLCEVVNSSDLYGRDSKWNALQPIVTCQLLLIDGIGEERQTFKELQTFEQVISARHRDMLPTVFASQFGLTKWIQAYAPYDHDKAIDMSKRIVSAMSGFRSGLTREETSQAISQHVINLSKGQ